MCIRVCLCACEPLDQHLTLLWEDGVGGSLCSSGCSGTHSVDQAVLDSQTHLLCLLSAGPRGLHHCAQLTILSFFKDLYILCM